MFVLQPKAGHQGSKIPFTEFRWIDPSIIEEVLPNYISLVRKISFNKTQVLHRLRLRQFLHRKPLPDIQITPQEWKPVSEMSFKDDDLYTRAWERDYGRPIFDAENNNLTPANSPETAVRYDFSTKKNVEHTRNFTRAFPRNFSKNGGIL